MPKPGIFFTLGLFSFLFIPLVLLGESRFFQSAEAYFAAPVPAIDHRLFLRVDGYGKGYFGASRNGGRKHMGLDFREPLGDPVYAAKSGRVVFAGENNGYGNFVEILHPGGLSTRYAHLSALYVGPGDWVWRGFRIGDCGRTGNAKNPQILPHLHFEIRQKGVALNPSDGLLDPSLKVEV